MAIGNQAPLAEPLLQRLYFDRPKRLLQNHDSLLSHFQLAVNILASAAILLGLAWLRDGRVLPQYQHLAIVMVLVMLVVYQWRGVFRRFSGLTHGALRIGRAWACVTAALLIIAFLTKSGDQFSRAVIGAWFVLAYLVQVAAYGGIFRVANSINLHYGQPVRVLVIGSRWLAEHLVHSLTNNNWIPDKVVGIVDQDDDGLAEWNRGAVPYLGKLEDIEQIVNQHRINRVYIALPISCSLLIEEIHADLLSAHPGLDIIWVPDIFAMQLLNHSVREINGLPLITLSESPLMSETQALSKAVMDKVAAAILLIMLSPLMLLTALAIKATSAGPVIFKQRRHGWDGRIIEVWKFRSMHVDHRFDAIAQAVRDDPRITAVGRLIRRTSIDELPQLINVLQGRMSLVGPRPHAVEHNDFYSARIRSYMLRHRIKPGITGLAQVRGLRGETETLEKMLRRVEVDIEYINRWSLWLDIKILIQTPLTLFSKDVY